MNCNIKTHSDNEYQLGDIGYYKWSKEIPWKGSGKLIGIDCSKVLVEHESNYVEVRSCNKLLVKLMSTKYQIFQIPNISEPIDKITKNQNNSHRSTSIQVLKPEINLGDLLNNQNQPSNSAEKRYKNIKQKYKKNSVEDDTSKGTATQIVKEWLKHRNLDKSVISQYIKDNLADTNETVKVERVNKARKSSAKHRNWFN